MLGPTAPARNGLNACFEGEGSKGVYVLPRMSLPVGNIDGAKLRSAVTWEFPDDDQPVGGRLAKTPWRISEALINRPAATGRLGYFEFELIPALAERSSTISKVPKGKF